MGGQRAKKPNQSNQNSNKATQQTKKKPNKQTKQKPTKSLTDILRIKLKDSSNSVFEPEMSWDRVLAHAFGK